MYIWRKQQNTTINDKVYIYITHLSYLPTPPLRQDMTQGQFLSEV